MFQALTQHVVQQMGESNSLDTACVLWETFTLSRCWVGRRVVEGHWDSQGNEACAADGRAPSATSVVGGACWIKVALLLLSFNFLFMRWLCVRVAFVRESIIWLWCTWVAEVYCESGIYGPVLLLEKMTSENWSDVDRAECCGDVFKEVPIVLTSLTFSHFYF